MITFDALRQDSLGAYGNSQGLTPNLDAFAGKGIVFANAYTAGQATPSSFAAAFTGQLPIRVFRKWQLQDVETLAEMYQAQGFITAAFINNIQLTAERHFDQGFETYQMFADRSDLEVEAEVQRWLRNPPQDRFFLWVHLINPHTPYERRDGFDHLFPRDYEGPYQQISPADIDHAELDRYNDLEKLQIRALYDAEVAYVDQLFGRIVNTLEHTGRMKDSLVLVSADHGESFAEHGYYGHRQLFDEVIRIPLMMRHPQATPGRIDFPVSNIDLVPTLADFSGLMTIPPIEGTSWYDTLTDDRPIFSMVMTGKPDFAMAVRSGDLKMITWCNPDDPMEAVFDLREDPGELHNQLESLPLEMGRLYQLMEAVGGRDPCYEIADASKGREQTDGLAEDTIEKLKSLGYIQ